MADTTIVNTPASSGENGAAGWFVAFIILVIVGGFMWYRYYGGHTAAAPAANINVTVPSPTTGGANDTVKTPAAAPAGATTY